jgi:hypothetical protein
LNERLEYFQIFKLKIKIWFQNRRAKDRKLGKRKRSDHKTTSTGVEQHSQSMFIDASVKSTTKPIGLPMTKPVVVSNQSSFEVTKKYANVEYLSWSDNNNNNTISNNNSSQGLNGNFNATASHDNYLF